MKSWFQSKTIWVNIILLALAIVAEVSKVFPVSQNPLVWSSVTAILNIILRFVTGEPIGTNKSS